MSGLAALSTGVFVALLVGLLSGGLPTLQRTTEPRGPSRLAVQLQQAGVGWTPLQVRVATAVGALLTMVVVAVVTGIPAMAVVPGVLVLAAPQALLRRRALARVPAVREAWPDALAMIGGSVRSGRPLSHAVVDVSLDGPVALRGPMAGLAARIQTVGMVPALQAVADAVGDPVTDRVVEVLSPHANVTVPGGAFYAFFELPEALGIDGSAFVERAVERRVLLVAGGVFSARDTHVRLSYAVEEDVLEEGLQAIVELLQGR